MDRLDSVSVGGKPPPPQLGLFADGHCGGATCLATRIRLQPCDEESGAPLGELGPPACDCRGCPGCDVASVVAGVRFASSDVEYPAAHVYPGRRFRYAFGADGSSLPSKEHRAAQASAFRDRGVACKQSRRGLASPSRAPHAERSDGSDPARCRPSTRTAEGRSLFLFPAAFPAVRGSNPGAPPRDEGAGGEAVVDGAAARVARLSELRRGKRREHLRTRCPRCGCSSETERCAVKTSVGDVGPCVPRGVLGLKLCSACDELLGENRGNQNKEAKK